MPRVNELIERLGPAHYLTNLDLIKGYCQVPLTEAAREKTAFATLGVYTSHIPADDGPTPVATPGIRSSIL